MQELSAVVKKALRMLNNQINLQHQQNHATKNNIRIKCKKWYKAMKQLW